MMTICLGKDKEVRLSAFAVGAIAWMVSAIATAVSESLSAKRK